MNLIILILLGLALLVAMLSCIGIMVMHDAFQRLQFCSAVVAFCPLLIVIALWIDQHDAQARIKAILIAVLLFVMNSVLTTATAKAARIRQTGHWEPHPDEKISIDGVKQTPGRRRTSKSHKK